MGVIKALKLDLSPNPVKDAFKKFFRINDDVYQKLPKFEEFPYDNNIGNVKNQLKLLRQRGRGNVWVKLKDLKNCLKAPTVHYGKKYKDGCQKIRNNCGKNNMWGPV